ncbi:hypothetical protein BH23GEM9_BH23GEM9_20540 [soil metagenome]
MLQHAAAALSAEPVLAAFEPLAAFMIVGSVLMIAVFGWAIFSPDVPDPDEGSDHSDEQEAKPAER